MRTSHEWIIVGVMLQVGHNTFGLSVIREYRPYTVHLCFFSIAIHDILSAQSRRVE